MHHLINLLKKQCFMDLLYLRQLQQQVKNIRQIQSSPFSRLNKINAYYKLHRYFIKKGTYFPTYYMIVGPLQRLYSKYFQQEPYFRPIKYQASKQNSQIYELPIHDKHSKRENVSLLIIVTGCEGMDIAAQKMMISMNTNGFKTFCIKTDDFHDLQRLKKTINNIKSKYGSAKCFGIGLDYGANLLVNYSAKYEKQFNGIVSIGNPLNLEQSQKKIENSNFIWKKLLYEDLLKNRIKNCQSYHNKILGKNTKIDQKNMSLYEIDRVCHGGQREENYSLFKQKASSLNSIKNLKQPSLFIQSQQDPFTISIEQNQEKLENQKCIFVQTQKGGHLQWFESMKMIRWVSKPIAQFFKYFDGR